MLNLYIDKAIEDCQNFNLRDGLPKDQQWEFQDFFSPPVRGTGLLSQDEHEAKKIMSFKRSNVFWKHLASLERFRDLARPVKSIRFLGVCFDDWEPLLQTLQQQGANIEKLEFRRCTFTERGAQLLGTILSSNNASLKNNSNNNKNETTSDNCFCIRDFDMTEPKGSLAWVDGFLQNKTVTHLSLVCIQMLYRAIIFVQRSPQIKKLKLSLLPEKGPEAEELEKNLFVDIDDDRDVDLWFLNLEFSVRQKFSLNLCLALGRLLRKANQLKIFHLRGAKSGIPHEFLRDSIHCHTLRLECPNIDPRILTFLINGNQDNSAGGNLKNLYYLNPRDLSKSQRFLELVDLSLLDKFEVNSLVLMKDLGSYFAQNKGPKNCTMWVIGDMNDSISELISGFDGNDKIEELDIKASSFSSDSKLQQAFVETTLEKMPKLRSWKMDIWAWAVSPEPSIDEDSEDEERRRNIPTKVWNEWIWDAVSSNLNIHEIDLCMPLESKVTNTVFLNKWRKLFRCHDKMSSGIWSRVLSRHITKDPENDLFRRFQVIKDIPSLFQQVADDAAEKKRQDPPNFVVPHDTNCPGCHKRRKTMPLSC